MRLTKKSFFSCVLGNYDKMWSVVWNLVWCSCLWFTRCVCTTIFLTSGKKARSENIQVKNQFGAALFTIQLQRKIVRWAINVGVYTHPVWHATKRVEKWFQPTLLHLFWISRGATTQNPFRIEIIIETRGERKSLIESTGDVGWLTPSDLRLR